MKSKILLILFTAFISLTSLFYISKQSVVQAQTTGHTVSGQVMNVGTTRPTQCNPEGLPGKNDVVLSLNGTSGTFQATSDRGGSQQDGAFYFNNVPDGLYNLCITQFPAGFSHYCNVQSWQPPTPTPQRDPFTSQCIKVNVAGANIDSLRMLVKADAADTTITPTITPTGPVNCSTRASGDVNCDGNINTLDYFYYVRKINGATVFPNNVNTDVNNSGATDQNDRTIIVTGIIGQN